MRYGEATTTTTFKCEGCGERFPSTSIYTEHPLSNDFTVFSVQCVKLAIERTILMWSPH